MIKAALALGLAGFAAASAVSIPVPARTARAHTLSVSGKCSRIPARYVGGATQEQSSLFINGNKQNGAYLKAGQEVETDPSGAALVCLRLGGTVCDLSSGTRLQIKPNKKALARLKFGTISCKTEVGVNSHIDKTVNFDTPAETIRLGAGRLSVGTLARGSGAKSKAGNTAGNLFSIRAIGTRTTVKVGRGVTTVIPRTSPTDAAVLGSAQQLTVKTRQKPGNPSQLHLTERERRTFAQLNALLPAITDTTKPQIRIAAAPPNRSSVRTASFSFEVSEGTAVLSCSLDAEPFHLCAKSETLDGLGPGKHTLAVHATDPTGNVGPDAKFTWNIDFSLIAFTSTRDGNEEIYVMNPDGKKQTRLTFNPKATNADPKWSPDRKRIAFHTNRDGNFEIYVMDANGGNQKDLTNNPAFDKNPAWSPDGQRIAFESGRGGLDEIYSMKADGTDIRRLTFNNAEDTNPAWSPDGTQIAFASKRDGNYQIYVMNADGTNQRNLSNNSATEFNPAWSPDGKLIAFHSDRQGGTRQIYVMNADGNPKSVRRVTSTSSTESNPVWAPDQAEIAFQSEGPDANSDIYYVSVPAAGQPPARPVRLTDDPAADSVPDWR